MGKSKNIESTGYDYNINLNQIGAVNAGLEGKITAIEIIIFESFIKFTTWNKCEKIVRSNEIFYHYHWQNVVNRIPFLAINSRTPIKRRFQNLVTNELLKPHPNNMQMGKSFYAFGVKYEAYSNLSLKVHPSSTRDAPIPNEVRDPSLLRYATRPYRGMLMIVLMIRLMIIIVIVHSKPI